MEPEITQDEFPDLTDDNIAAALGYATTLSEPLLSQMMPAGDETMEEEPEEESDTMESDDEQDQAIAELRTKIEQLEAEINDEEGTETEENTGTEE